MKESILLQAMSTTRNVDLRNITKYMGQKDRDDSI